MKKRILLIIPAYNEEKNILNTYNKILKYNKTSNLKLDAIVINDGSIDTTGKICSENNIPHIDLIHNLGIGGAVQTGYKYALNNDYDIAIQFDGDGQHDVNYVEKLIEPILEGKSQFSIGSRFIHDEGDFKSSKIRRIGICIISKLIWICTKHVITDPTSGFRAADKEIINYFAMDYPTEYPEPSSIVDLIKRDKKIVEVPVNMIKRKAGKSSINSWKQAYYMFNVLLSIIISSMKKGGMK